MPVRRSADPICVQHVWDAIRSANSQKQVADFQRIVKYLQRVDQCTPLQAELYLSQATDDGFVVAIQKTAIKGPKTGLSVESYRIPIPELSMLKTSGHDWYCIECHLAGDVTLCNNCHRVYHTECWARAKQKQHIFKNKRIKAKIVMSPICLDSSLEESNATERLSETIPENTESINNNLKEETDIQKHNNPPAEDANDNLEDHFVYDENLCSICNMSQFDTSLDLEKEELNHLLSFILERIRSWLPDCIMHTMAPEPRFEWMTESELSWRANQLFYLQMDMFKMDEKIRKLEYSMLYEFQTDVVTIQHNVAIFHGIESQEYGAAELMLRDCVHDMKELINCVDCYKHSNEKINNNWFCLPCRNPHKLVWAKQKGYPYWPAKVINETDTTYDVRFFGGKYERSVLPKNFIKPITIDPQKIQIKRTMAFNKAYEQLLLHQKLLENPGDASKLIPVKNKRKPPVKPRKLNTIIKFTNSKHLDGTDIYEFQDSPNVSPRGRKRKHSTNSLDFNKTNLTIRLKKKIVPKHSLKKNSSDVIHISDDDVPLREGNFSVGYDCGNEQVTSSTEECFNAPSEMMQKLEQPYSDAVERMRRKLEQSKEKNHLIKIAMDCMQAETDRIVNENNEHLKKIFEAHHAQLSETKKKQWCYNCEQDAIYHCCWNTAYCSQTCQQQHWQAEHKKVCRRKR